MAGHSELNKPMFCRKLEENASENVHCRRFRLETVEGNLFTSFFQQGLFSGWRVLGTVMIVKGRAVH
jgi:hypothetical protein